MKTSQQHYDVVVCGAGIVGMATALQLAKQSLKVALLAPEIAPKHDLGQDYHPRIYAISQSSKTFLQHLGIWSTLPQQRLTAVKHMQVYGDQGGLVALEPNTEETILSWICESGEIEYALYRALQYSGVQHIQDTVQHFLDGRVITAKGLSVTCSLLIGADGAKSTVRQLGDIEYHKQDYHDTGMVLQLTTQKPHNNTAFQWFGEHGVLAFLPLPDTAQGHQVSMVWSAPDSMAHRWLQKTTEQVATELPLALNAICGRQLGDLKVRSRLLGFPLTLERSGMIANKIALVGDAAHRVHPLAGQGLNLGLNDVEVLCRLIAERESFREPGDYRILQRYRIARAEAIWQMRFVTHGLHGLFRHTEVPIVMLRNLGMSVVNRMPIVKQLLLKKAAGDIS
ncbi:FAD-dependent oxidoreductase [Brackiella oedipodis]|uniref:FAD-dependent oxidoreductase n=1 Tax=Brackiella oedipodis TaxID=124225 RepID=UPI0005702CD9|nr:FAD-dependent oxidoreductase [Brackiella oedipodis]